MNKTGIVKWFNKGMGFIVDSETGADVFVHWSSVIFDGYKKLYENDEVTYDIEETEKGLNAINVKLQKRSYKSKERKEK
jgi:CspA family cold shock protein